MPKSIHNVYKSKKGRDTQKTTPSPHLQPNQSMKSNQDNVVSLNCTLTHSKNMYKKGHKIAQPIKSESSKALRFLFFHIAQNKHKGAAFHAFFLFFPIKAPRQLRRASLIEKGMTHCTSKRAKIRCHSLIALGQ